MISSSISHDGISLVVKATLPGSPCRAFLSSNSPLLTRVGESVALGVRRRGFAPAGALFFACVLIAEFVFMAQHSTHLHPI